MISKALIEDFGLMPWNENNNGLLLIRPEHLSKIPPDYKLTSISGSVQMAAGADDDTRAGYLAYGVVPKQYEEFLRIMLDSGMERKPWT